ncbi:unnamed protein product [Alopecurus aequalis]
MAAASLSRLSRRASASAAPSLRRALYSTAAASPSPAAASPPLPPAAAGADADRVRWDYRGQRQLVPLGQWLPKVAVDAYVAPEAVLAGQVTVHDGASVWSGSVLRGDLNKITLGFCANVQERCVLHAAWSAPTASRRPRCLDDFLLIGVIWNSIMSILPLTSLLDMLEMMIGGNFHWESTRSQPSGIYLGWLPERVICNIGLPAETLVDRYVTVGAYCLLRSCTIEPECIIGQHSILMEGSLVETNSILEAGSVLPPGRRIPTGELWAGNPARFVRKLTNEEIMEIPKLAVAINDLMQSHFSEFLPYSNAYLEVEKLKKQFSVPL